MKQWACRATHRFDTGSKGGRSVMIPNLPTRYDSEMARRERKCGQAFYALMEDLSQLVRVAGGEQVFRCCVKVSKSKTAGRLSPSRFRVRKTLFGLLKTVTVWIYPTKRRVKTHYCLMK